MLHSLRDFLVQLRLAGFPLLLLASGRVDRIRVVTALKDRLERFLTDHDWGEERLRPDWRAHDGVLEKP